ncbi:MAG: hypothetical protein RSG52_07725 [Terrisporobacter sp.]|uniref:hypothetical protein n=1 Tax=Terrisporobacter sp. TaxID=1965305 RepID=UPI002FC7137B
MKKIVTLIITMLMVVSLAGCSSKTVERDPVLSEDLNKVIEKIYDTADLNNEQREALKYYQTTDLDKSNVEGILGSKDIKFEQGIISAPMMSAVPYQLVLLKLDEKADVKATKELILKNANPRKWVCVEAEEVIVENIDNTVLFIMANKEDATPVKDAFMALSEVK